jgi:hypothetical protein
MPGWIIAAAIVSIAVTGILTFVLWRLNAPLRERGKQDSGGGDGGYVATHDGGSSRTQNDSNDGTSDGGSDGGGGGGGE